MTKKMQIPPEAPHQGKSSSDNRLAVLTTGLVDEVSGRIEQLLQSAAGFALPDKYAYGTALQAAMLQIEQVVDKNRAPALKVCTRTSIAQALLMMVVQGLSPQRVQCYFVVYGDRLVCMRSYFGAEAIVQRIYPGARLSTAVVYAGDEFEMGMVKGRQVVVKHTPSFQNIGGLETVVGGYGIWEFADDTPDEVAIMTIEQIKNSWRKGKVYVEGKAGTTHEQHPEEMVKRTLCNRVSKRLINSADDSHLVLSIFQADGIASDALVDAEVLEHANTGEALDFPPPDAAIVEVVPVQPVVPVDGPSAITGVTEQAWEPGHSEEFPGALRGSMAIPEPLFRESGDGAPVADNPKAADPTVAGMTVTHLAGTVLIDPKGQVHIEHAEDPIIATTDRRRTPTTTPPPGTATVAPPAPAPEPAPQEPFQLRTEDAVGPHGRFLELVANHNLSETKAVAVLKTSCRVATLTGDNYRAALQDPRSFLALYHGRLTEDARLKTHD